MEHKTTRLLISTYGNLTLANTSDSNALFIAFTIIALASFVFFCYYSTKE